LDHLDGKLFIDRVSESDEKEIHDDVERLFRYGKTHKFCRIRRK